jgi:hypothetical protein
LVGGQFAEVALDRRPGRKDDIICEGRRETGVEIGGLGNEVDRRMGTVDDRNRRRLDLGVDVWLDWVEWRGNMATADWVLEATVNVDWVALDDVARVIENKNLPEGPVGFGRAPHVRRVLISDPAPSISGPSLSIFHTSRSAENGHYSSWFWKGTGDYLRDNVGSRAFCMV